MLNNKSHDNQRERENVAAIKKINENKLEVD